MGDTAGENAPTEKPKPVMNYNPDAEDNAVHALCHFNKIP